MIGQILRFVAKIAAIILFVGMVSTLVNVIMGYLPDPTVSLPPCPAHYYALLDISGSISLFIKILTLGFSAKYILKYFLSF